MRSSQRHRRHPLLKHLPAVHRIKYPLIFLTAHQLRSIRAKQVLAAAEAEAKKRNWKMNIAVVDPNGDLIYFARMDGAMLPSIEISQGKARTAARWRRESRLFYNAMEAGRSYLPTVDKTLVANPGGYPLIEDGKIVGGIGCSGGTGDQDAAICKVGADLIK